ncbi:MAG: NUDIX domain-containing protein [Spirulina sp. DLM2.Bin59]|nr:MAG: NUDIX domain-containing protein [Spirulina sp. DLM2.Bin59]
MAKKSKIRVIALALIHRGDDLFLSLGRDPETGREFCRALGGGVEFGETSADALRREFQEELQAELANVAYLGCIESLFTYNNIPHHEIIQLYRADFVDQKFYDLDVITFHEGDGCAKAERTKEARWIPLGELQTNPDRLVPAACWQYLDELAL